MKDTKHNGKSDRRGKKDNRAKLAKHSMLAELTEEERRKLLCVRSW